MPGWMPVPARRDDTDVKKRTGEPWIPAVEYGALLHAFTVNLVVRDIDRAACFYREVLRGLVHYSDPDFAAIKVGCAELMLHADHTDEANPWHARLSAGELRGLGTELRLLGMDPDEVAARADAVEAVFKPVADRGTAGGR